MIDVGSSVWVPDEVQAWLPGHVTSINAKEAVLKTETGKEVRLSGAEKDALRLTEEGALKGVQDMIQLQDLNEGGILHNLRVRYDQGQIYTYTSSILISINPYKMLPLYTPAVVEQYRRTKQQELPPHVYKLADDAYRNLVDHEADQSLLISGESGAGKSEATKVALEYLADLSGGSGGIEEKILQANPIMEAFGNAKTVRNNNSSRFGKYISIYFENGTMVAGEIQHYLLEKSRVTIQAKTERNYHIFYQILEGSSKEERAKLFIEGKDETDNVADSFKYLNKSGTYTIPGVSDGKDFEKVRHAMTTCDLSEQDQDTILKIVAAILHLGNVEFVPESKGGAGDGSRVKNPESCARVGQLLSIDADQLEFMLCNRALQGRGSVMPMPQTPEQAEAGRDALAKGIYSSLFSYIIKAINRCLIRSTSNKLNTIGVLDIFGFEIFEINSLEQLCINYCNERLQQHFNMHIFKMEQAEYQTEGIPVSYVEFVDNQDAIDLISKKPSGILPLLDEEVLVGKRGSDSNFLEKLTAAHDKKHQSYQVPKGAKSKSNFVLRHFAGEVMYDTNGFLDKNKDILPQDLHDLVASSDNTLIAELLPKVEEDEAASRRGGKKKVATLGGHFEDSLVALMTKLQGTEPHFIRCIKPNPDKVGNKFVGQMVLSQLRCSGMLEAIKVRQSGFPVRFSHASFAKRFKIVLTQQPAKVPADTSDLANLAKEIALQLEQAGVLQPHKWQMGKTKVFMKNDQHSKCELARAAALSKACLRLQAFARGCVTRKRMKIIIAANKRLHSAVAARQLDELKLALDDADDAGLKTKIVTEGKKLYDRLKKEKEAFLGLKQAMEERTLSKLNEAIMRAESLGLESIHPSEMASARALVAAVEREEACLSEIKQAMIGREIAALTDALKKAESLNITPAKLKAAYELKQALEDEIDAHNKLQAAIASRSVASLESALARAKALKLDDDLTHEASRLMTRLKEEDALRTRLKAALVDPHERELRAALIAAHEFGLENEPLLDQLTSKLNEMEEKAKEAARKAKEDAMRQIIEEKRRKEEEARNHDDMKKKAEAEAAIAQALSLADYSGEDDKEFEVDQILERLRGALGTAASAGLTTVLVDQARTRMARLESLKQAVLRLQEALASNDLVDLRQALGGVLELGVKAAIIARAKKVISELAEQAKATEIIAAATGGAALASQGTAVAESEESAPPVVDTDALAVGIKKAEAAGMSKEDIEKAQQKLEQASKQKEVKEKLRLAVAAESKEKLVEALDLAKDTGLTVADLDVKVAQCMLDEMVLAEKRAEEEKLRDERAKQEAAAQKLLEEANRLEETRKRLAGVPTDLATVRDRAEYTKSVYELQFYDSLRNADDFVKGKLLGKAKLKASMLTHSKEPIPTSLTKLDSELTKEAIVVFKNILGYAGDKTSSYPETLAEDVLKKGVQKPELRTEIFAQLVKQTCHNESDASCLRVWKLLAMCLQLFYPPKEIELYILHHANEHAKRLGEIGGCAHYCEYRCLFALASFTQIPTYPTPETISQYNERTPAYVRVELVSGEHQGKFFEPGVTVAEFNPKFGRELGLTAEDYFSLFFADVDGDLAVPEKAIFVDAYYAQLAAKKEVRVIFKKRLFVPSEPFSLTSPSTKLVFEQVYRDIARGCTAVQDVDQAVLLGAHLLKVFGEKDADDLGRFIEKYVPVQLRAALDRNKWKKRIVSDAEKMPSVSVEQAQVNYLEAFRKLPLYGIVHAAAEEHTKHFKKVETVAVNYEGVYLLDKKMEVISQLPYMTLKSWGSNATTLKLIGAPNPKKPDNAEEIVFKFARAKELCDTMNTYVSAILFRKSVGLC
eukprot:TRINITY_DN2392_c0_g2::TRINITY_DN2392_c0_g2_i1::g.20869::m.20869 TRINITY_DN2392_c0_g2::TRINITY_DN2392_c0_g2_i1::g.20869  ORF type:complete len:1862 (+),score=613.81,sp/P47808/MYSH_ACACA/32.75/0.0,Myosin_head/PF00063.16/5.8e-227,MyTH4/PF00784.12/1e+04,MyTH4/PF00784.12/7.5e-16,Myosin_N/PF02736.14/1.7e-06,FERM_M/PF00373.13/4.6e+03,FERM_M/PF00373.13/4.5e-06,IQ/PF00612.22/0.16,Imm5/PF14423.1/0.24 TRINITY_DN2392_c0_g2_i1:87-5588(+)